MAVKIRLRRQGRTHRPFYRLVVCDSRNPRDGRYVESVGWYNPFEEEADKHVNLKTDRLRYWLGEGATLSENAETFVARNAPDIVKELRAQVVAKRAKMVVKRKAQKARRQAKG